MERLQMSAELCVGSAPGHLWEELVCRYGPGLKARIGRVLRRAGMRPRGDLVEEIAQEVYYRLLVGGGHRIQSCHAASDRQLAAFLGKVAERVALDELRAARAKKRGRDRLVEGEDGDAVADPQANPEERMLGRERMRLLLARCGTLAGCRKAQRNARIVSLAASGWSHEEIARHLGGTLSPRGIDGLLRRLRRRAARHPAGSASGLPR